MKSLVIQTQNLTKKYDDFTAVDSLNLDIQEGEIFGMLGPNGSGKTTTILMLLGLTEPTHGKVEILGLDPSRKPLSVKAQVGYLPDQIGFYDNLTAEENLIYIAKLNGLSRPEANQRINESLDRMGLKDAANKKVKTYSRGMRQRLGVAEQLIKKPKIIIMDEPTLGLDPEAAHRFLNLISEFKNQGITILLSSHLLQQVQETCDRVGLFYHGQIKLEGTIPELSRQVMEGGYKVKVQAEGNSQEIEKQLRTLSGLVDLQHPSPDHYVLIATNDLRSEAAQAVIRANGQLKSLDIDVPSLEEIYTRYFEEMEHDRTD